MKSRTKLGKFIFPGVLLFPFLQSLYICPFPLPWIACNECPIFSCLMNPKTTPIRKLLLVNFVVSGFLVGRIFCSWTCPFGMLQEASSTFFGKFRRVNSLGKGLKVIKVFLVLLTFLVAFGLAYPILLSFLPWLSNLPFMTNLVYATSFALNSFILTVPWLTGLLRTFIFVSALSLAILYRRIWCKICPLGTVISIFNKLSLIKLKVNPEKCSECSRCSANCQMKLKPQLNGLNSVDCIRCLDCLLDCESSAIEVKPRFLKSPFKP